MSSSRYERVPQLDDSISLNTVHLDDSTDSTDNHIPDITPADSHYNYNSGVPTSPPPSFRSRTSSVAYPSRTGGSGANTFPSLSDNQASHSYTTPDFSTVLLTPGTSERTAVGEAGGSDAGDEGSEALIRAMSKRIERLEESIGRLLMEKSSPPHDPNGQRCCSTIVEPVEGYDPEAGIRTGDCCVRVQPRQTSGERTVHALLKAGFLALILIITWSLVYKSMDKRRGAK